MIVNESTSASKKPASAPEGNADGWFTPLRFAAMLALFLIASFPGVLFGQETFFYRDYGLFTYPVAHYIRECFWRGEVPLWNPLNNLGLPLLAQWNTCVLYPPSLFYMLFPLSWSLAVFNLAHLWWGGLGMYFLAHRWTKNRLAASVAGVAFGFNGLGLHLTMWISNLGAWAWMPWVVLLVEQCWTQRSVPVPGAAVPESPTQKNFRQATEVHPLLRPERARSAILLASLAGAMQMLAGAPEIIILTWALLGAMALTRLFAREISFAQLASRTGLIVVLVAGLSAAQLLPFFELLKHSHRSPGYTNADWAMPFSGLADFLVPLFHCFDSGHGVFVQYGQYWIASYFVGTGLLVFALAGALFARNRRVWLLLLMMLLCLWLALGANGFLYPLIGKLVPLLGLMRYPIKFVVLPIFILPLLAAYGVSWFQSQSQGANASRPKNILRNIALALAVLITAIVFVAWKYQWVRDDWSATWHCAAGRLVFLALAPAMLVLAVRTTEFKLQVLLRCALLALLWLDVYTHAPVLLPTVQRSIYEPGQVREYLKLAPEANGEPRFMGTLAMTKKLHTISLTNAAQEYYVHRSTLYDNCNLLDDVPTADGFYSLFLREPVHVRDLLFAADERHIDLKGLKDFLGIAYISADAENALDWKPRESALPLITGGQQPAFLSEADTDALLFSTNFDPRKIIVLPLEARETVKAARADVKIISPEIRPQHLNFGVEATASALVAIAQGHYPAWHAYVDGQRVPLWHANIGFQALEVPAGRHEVRVVYEDLRFRIGAMISLSTLFVVILKGLSAWKKKAS